MRRADASCVVEEFSEAVEPTIGRSSMMRTGQVAAAAGDGVAGFDENAPGGRDDVPNDAPDLLGTSSRSTSTGPAERRRPVSNGGRSEASTAQPQHQSDKFKNELWVFRSLRRILPLPTPLLSRGQEERKRGREKANTGPHSSNKSGNTHELDCRNFCSCWVAFGFFFEFMMKIMMNIAMFITT